MPLHSSVVSGASAALGEDSNPGETCPELGCASGPSHAEVLPCVWKNLNLSFSVLVTGCAQWVWLSSLFHTHTHRDTLPHTAVLCSQHKGALREASSPWLPHAGLRPKDGLVSPLPPVTSGSSAPLRPLQGVRCCPGAGACCLPSFCHPSIQGSLAPSPVRH